MIIKICISPRTVMVKSQSTAVIHVTRIILLMGICPPALLRHWRDTLTLAAVSSSRLPASQGEMDAKRGMGRGKKNMRRERTLWKYKLRIVAKSNGPQLKFFSCLMSGHKSQKCFFGFFSLSTVLKLPVKLFSLSFKLFALRVKKQLNHLKHCHSETSNEYFNLKHLLSKHRFKGSATPTGSLTSLWSRGKEPHF